MVTYRDKSGQVIDVNQWVWLAGNEKYRRIGSTEIPGRGWVSTVWIGIGHTLFETMAFAEGHELDQEPFLTWTEAEALNMHAQIVKRVMRG